MRHLVKTLFILLVIIACSTSSDSDEKSKPQTLEYSPNSISTTLGNSVSSNAPTVDDGGSTITSYELVQNFTGISIDATTGVITSSTATAVGNYELDVIATNGQGSTTFLAVMTVNIVATATKPVSMTYNPNSMSLFTTTSKTSAIPSINNGGLSLTDISIIGTAPTGISINKTTGRIIASSDVVVGTYQISVSLTNSLGTTEFQNVYTVEVVDISNAVTFTGQVRDLIEVKCQPCHVDGGSQENWTIYANAKAKAQTIKTRTGNGSMPQGGANGGLTQAEKDVFAQWVDDGALE